MSRSDAAEYAGDFKAQVSSRLKLFAAPVYLFMQMRRISLDLPLMGTRLLRTASKRTVSLAQKANQYP